MTSHASRALSLAEAAWEHYRDHEQVQWVCPICHGFVAAKRMLIPDVIVRHAMGHPVHLPARMLVADMLDLLPSLIREAVATIDAPNPEDRIHVRHTRTDPPVFSQIRLLRLANPASESSLFRDLEACSRIIWEQFDTDARRQHPQPVGELSWGAELAWLRSAWPDAQAYLDKQDLLWITAEIRHITETFAALARVHKQPRYLCPTSGCREQMHLGDDDWMTCDAGHQHPGPKRLEREWRRKPPMPTRALCEALRIPEGTVWRWHHEGRIVPSRQEGRTLFWLPWDVIVLRYPDIAEAIDNRDSAA